MFIPSPNLAELRQGDVLKGLYYPEPNASDLLLEGKANEPLHQTLTATAEYVVDTKSLKWMSGRIRYLLRGYVMVISQCCDLEVKQSGLPKTTSIVLAPILDIPPSISNDPDKLAKLKANSIVEFINFYFLSNYPPTLAIDHLVNLNRLFSMSREGFPFLLSRKALEMTVDARFQLKSKLQYNFSRPAGDDNHLYEQTAQGQAPATGTP